MSKQKKKIEQMLSELGFSYDETRLTNRIEYTVGMEVSKEAVDSGNFHLVSKQLKTFYREYIKQVKEISRDKIKLIEEFEKK